MVSICFLTIDRFDILKDAVDHNLAHAGVPYELCIVDNGSKDPRVHEYLKSLNNVRYLRFNETNEGVAPMFNECFHHSLMDYICLMGNDIKMSNNWAAKLIEAHNVLPDAGWDASHCAGEKGIPFERNGIKATQQWNAFGTALFSREVFERVGYFCNRYAPYGLEDSDYHHRLNMMGYKQYYVDSVKSSHLGDDVHSKSEYRQMKWASLEKNQVIFGEQIEHYTKINNYYIPYRQ